MKKLFLIVALLCFAHGAFAQDLSVPQRTLDLSGGYQPFTLTSAATTAFFNTTGMDSHAVSYTLPANVTGITVTVSASTDGGTTYATVGTSTTGAGTISFTGTYFIVKVVESGMTAAMPAIAGVYNGTLMAGHAALAAITPNSTYPNPFGITVTNLSTTSGTVATASTVLMGTLVCVNSSTSSSVAVNTTNTAGNPLQGVAFVIPASSDKVMNFNSGMLAVGVKWWASTATAWCSMTGWQQ